MQHWFVDRVPDPMATWLEAFPAAKMLRREDIQSLALEANGIIWFRLHSGEVADSALSSVRIKGGQLVVVLADEPDDALVTSALSFGKNPSRRALLVKTGTLKGHALKGRTRKGAVEFVFPLEYERVHNEGLKAGRGAGFQMPKRQFVGESKVLTDRITKKVQKLLEEHLKKQ